jgi:hypothetical protein
MKSNGNGPSPARFPVPVRHFLLHAHQYLQRGDVVLLKGRASIFSWAVRWWTRSEFSHAALVFSVPSTEDGFERTFLIEASIDGVDITDLRHYARDLSLIYDIAIKRCEQPWMTVDVQRSIRGHMLNYIKANYDYWTILGFMRRLTSRRSRPEGNSPEAQRKSLWRRRPPNSFVCSGFVQYGFLAAVSRLTQTHELPREALEQVLFKPGLHPDAPPQEILATSPEDLATTDRLTWKYAIRGGKVYEVGSYDQVRHLFSSSAQP